MTLLRLASLILFLVVPLSSWAQSGPLRIEITEGVIEPMPIAVPTFVAETPQASGLAQQIAEVVAQDLEGSGLFRPIDGGAFIARVSNFDSPVTYADWRAINAQALVTGSISQTGRRIDVRFRLYDVFAGEPLGDGLQFGGDQDSWRRIAHKVSDAVYSRITGEDGYFDSRVVFVSQTGPKDRRVKRLAVMDYDGANASFLSDGNALVLAPRFSPQGDRVLYTSYETGKPRIYLLDVKTLQRRVLDEQPGTMTFAPRFSPDGNTVVYSASTNGNAELFSLALRSGRQTRLTSAPSIETAPSFSPDGRQIVFESDRSGSQQLYVMPAAGGEPKRISFGAGRYGTPVWSPRGDLIAFTKQNSGRFHIGVMRTDGSEERLLTASFLDEGPTWAPNGRVIMFTRETRGADGAPALYTVDITGRNLRRVETPVAASAPAWSPLLP